MISSLHQVEITSRCNLKCRYCPSPHLQRPKVDMTLEIFEKALKWAKYFVDRGTQRELNLAGIGESTMHPSFVEFVALARKTLGQAVHLTMATNGLLMTDEMARAIAPYRPKVWVSLHRPEKAGPAVEALRRVGLYMGASSDPSLAAINWAGQVNWFTSAGARQPCPWLTQSRVMVMADGNVTQCCIDANGSGIMGTIDDDLSQMSVAPYKLCETCDQYVALKAVA